MACDSHRSLRSDSRSWRRNGRDSSASAGAADDRTGFGTRRIRAQGSCGVRRGGACGAADGKSVSGKRGGRGGAGDSVNGRKVRVLGRRSFCTDGIGFWRNAGQRARSGVDIAPSEAEADAASGANRFGSTVLFVRARRNRGEGFSRERVNTSLKRAWGAWRQSFAGGGHTADWDRKGPVSK